MESLKGKRHWPVLGCFVVLSLLLGCQPEEPEVEEERALSVEVEEAKKGSMAVETTLSGEVHPSQRAHLAPKVGGRVRRVYTSTGEQVAAGQPLLALEEKEIQDNVRQAEASLKVAEAALARTQEQQEQAERELERTKTLYEQGAVTEQELENAQMQASETAVNDAKAQVNQARVALEIAESALEDTVMKSPIEGTVIELDAEVGEMLSPQSPVAVVAVLDPVLVKTSVSEYLINQFSQGQAVTIDIPSASTEMYPGTVKFLAPAPATGTRTFSMEVAIENPDRIVKPGMFAEIDLTTEERENVLIVPSEAVIVREGHPVVFLAEEGRAVMREVEVGLDNGNEAEILSGLEQGDPVIVRGQDFLDEGDRINRVTNGEGDPS